MKPSPITHKFESTLGPIVVSQDKMETQFAKDPVILKLLRKRADWEEALDVKRKVNAERAAVIRANIAVVNREINALYQKRRAMRNSMQALDDKLTGSMERGRISSINGQIASRKYHLSKQEARRVAAKLAKAAIARISRRHTNKVIPSGPVTDLETTNEPAQESIGPVRGQNPDPAREADHPAGDS